MPGEGPAAATAVPDAVRFGWFDGILEGTATDPAAVGAAVAELNRSGPARFALTVEALRCSILADDRPLAGERFRDPRAGESLVRGIEALVARLDGPEEPESTLRCTLVHDATVQETIFAVRGRAVRPVARERPVLDSDLARRPRGIAAGSPEANRMLWVGIAFLMLIAGVLSAWQKGLIDRIAAARAETLEVRRGAFGDTLDASVQESWGEYRVLVKRGRGYPPDAASVEAPATASTAERAARRIVANGETICLLVRAKDGTVLASAPVSLRGLLAREDGEVVAAIPGKRRAAAVELSLADVAVGAK